LLEAVERCVDTAQGDFSTGDVPQFVGDGDSVHLVTEPHGGD